MEKIKISVIITTYNSGKTINRCIESVINQTYRNIEIIIIDGGSNDDTINIIRDLKHHYKNLYFCLTNYKSQTKQLNLGIQKSKGEFVFFLDSDDCINTNFIRAASIYFKNSDIIQPNIVSINIEMKKKASITVDFKTKILTTNNVFGNGYGSAICNAVNFYRKELIQNIRFNEKIYYGQDLLFNYNVARLKPIISHSKKSIYYYFNNVNLQLKKYKINRYFKLINELLSLKHEVCQNKNNYLGYQQIIFSNFNSIQNSKYKLYYFLLYPIISFKIHCFYYERTKNKNYLILIICPPAFYLLRCIKNNILNFKNK